MIELNYVMHHFFSKFEENGEKFSGKNIFVRDIVEATNDLTSNSQLATIDSYSHRIEAFFRIRFFARNLTLVMVN